MIDRIHVQGNEVAFDDDFEWVNVWATAEKPQRKSRDEQLLAPVAPRLEAHSPVPREEEMPAVAVARNVEAAAPQDDIVSAPRASAAAAALLLDAVSVVPPAAATAATPPPVAEPVPPPSIEEAAIVPSVEEAAIVTPDEALVFAFAATPASAKTSAEATEIIDLDLADIVQNTDTVCEPPEEANAPISFFEAARRMGRWTSLFRMMTRSGASSAAAARDLFMAEAPPGAPSLDEPVDEAEQETAARTEEDAAMVAAAKAKAAQLARDIAEIAAVRDRLLAMPVAPRPLAGKTQPLVRTSDYVPILVGAVLAFTSLIVFGAAASFVSLR